MVNSNIKVVDLECAFSEWSHFTLKWSMGGLSVYIDGIIAKDNVAGDH